MYALCASVCALDVSNRLLISTLSSPIFTVNYSIRSLIRSKCVLKCCLARVGVKGPISKSSSVCSSDVWLCSCSLELLRLSETSTSLLLPSFLMRGSPTRNASSFAVCLARLTSLFWSLVGLGTFDFSDTLPSILMSLCFWRRAAGL